MTTMWKKSICAILTCWGVFITGSSAEKLEGAGARTYGDVVVVDLSSGKITGSNSQVNVSELLSYPIDSYAPCNKMGVAKINFAAGKHKKVRMYLTFDEPSQYVYHISDEQQSNHHSGRGHTPSGVQGFNDRLEIHIQNHPDGWRDEVVRRGTTLKECIKKVNQFRGRVRIDVSDNRVMWKTHETMGVSTSKYLFPYVSSSGDKALWIGMNRFVDTVAYHGTGLCKVTIFME